MSKYSAANAHISFIRQSLRETSDDSNYTDEQIYYALLLVRGLVLSRKLKKGKILPTTIYQTICFLLCEATYAECQACFNVPLDCYVLKTTIDVPEALWSGSAEALRVSTITGQEIAPITEQQHKNREYRKTGKNNMYYIRMNGKLAILNVPNNELKGIKISAIFNDPIHANLVSGCPNQTACEDALNTSLGVDMEDMHSVYNETLKLLLTTYKLPEDRSNNASSNVKSNQI